MTRSAMVAVAVTLGAFLIPAIFMLIVSMGYEEVARAINPLLKEPIPSAINLEWTTFLAIGALFQVILTFMTLDDLWKKRNFIPPTEKNVLQTIYRIIRAALVGIALWVILLSLYTFGVRQLNSYIENAMLENFPRPEILFITLQFVCYISGIKTLLDKTFVDIENKSMLREIEAEIPSQS